MSTPEDPDEILRDEAIDIWKDDGRRTKSTKEEIDAAMEAIEKGKKGRK